MLYYAIDKIVYDVAFVVAWQLNKNKHQATQYFFIISNSPLFTSVEH